MGLDMYAYSANKAGAQTEYWDNGEIRIERWLEKNGYLTKESTVRIKLKSPGVINLNEYLNIASNSIKTIHLNIDDLSVHYKFGDDFYMLCLENKYKNESGSA